MDENAKKRIRLIFNPKDQFPSKLYDVCNDGYLIRWNRNGSVSVPDEDAFEANVMDLYPGFLQIPSFVNFRRLFREYGFEWVINQDNILEFSHPLFVRGRKQLLPEIKTRRKSFQNSHPVASSTSEIIEAEPGKRYATRRRRRTKQFAVNENTNKPDFSGGGEDRFRQNINQNIYGGLKTQTLQSGIQIVPPSQLQIQKPEVRQPADLKPIQQNFVQNELTEEEFMQWLARKRMIEDMKVKENLPETVNKEFVWMYYDSNGERPEFEKTKQGDLLLTPVINENKSDQTKTSEVPCGMCKCCVAMSLLSAGSSVVTDDSFMVDVDSDIEVTEVIVEEHDPEDSPACKKSKANQEASVQIDCTRPNNVISQTESMQSAPKEIGQIETSQKGLTLSTHREFTDEISAQYTCPGSKKEALVSAKEEYTYGEYYQLERPQITKFVHADPVYLNSAMYTKAEYA